MKPHIWYDINHLFWRCSYRSSYHSYFEFGKGVTPNEAYQNWVGFYSQK
jgi:hypothetical protein